MPQAEANETRGEPEAPLQFGKYRLLRLLARGGMGEVYLARLQGELGFEKDLVIKTILPELAAKPRFIELFAAEAKTAVALSHGNIVPTYELGRWGETFYIAMGYVDGPSLSQILRAARRRKIEPNVPAALHVIRGVLTGLAYAHRDEPGRHAVVHRDISPRNVLVDRSGQVRIVDFGIAARAREQVELRAGSQGYMAPEQARAEAADPRADVFSVACLLYEMLTHDKAFPKDGVWTPPPLDEVPDLVRDPLQAALSLEPEARPADAADLLRQLRPALAEHAATFADHDLAVMLADLFPDGWLASEPASAGKTSIQDLRADNQTFATRLTAVTKVHQVDVDGSGSGAGSTIEGSGAMAVTGRVAASMSTSSLSTPASMAPTALPRRSIASTLAWVAAGGALVFLVTRALEDPAPAVPPGDPPPTAAAGVDAHPADADPRIGPANRAGTTDPSPDPGEAASPDAPAGGSDPPAAVTHRLSVQPADAEVWADGRRIEGTSPFSLSLPPEATTKVVIKKEGFETRTLNLTQDGELPAKVRLVAVAPKGNGYLRVSAPGVSWAEVLVDGKKIATTPTSRLTLPAGRHRIEVRCIPEACPSERMLLKQTVMIRAEETTVLTAGG